jgi:hypothetical protein
MERNGFGRKALVGGLVLALLGGCAGSKGSMKPRFVDVRTENGIVVRKKAEGQESYDANGPSTASVVKGVGSGVRALGALTDFAAASATGGLLNTLGGFMSLKENAEQSAANRPAKKNNLYVVDLGDGSSWEDKLDSGVFNRGPKGWNSVDYFDVKSDIGLVGNVSGLEGKRVEFRLLSSIGNEVGNLREGINPYTFIRKKDYVVEASQNFAAFDLFEGKQVPGRYRVDCLVYEGSEVVDQIGAALIEVREGWDDNIKEGRPESDLALRDSDER